MNIALLTDFGTRDYFVGAMKGMILSIDDEANIIDITHEIEPQNIRAASFTLRACYKNFPPKTIFVSVVDPGVGSARRAILIETEDYYFIAPDNGLLSFVFDESQSFRVFEIANQKFFNHPVSRTFHGRDIFAPVAAHLSKGISPDNFGTEIFECVKISENLPVFDNRNAPVAEIIHIDRFGNLITNLTVENLTRSFSLEINGQKIVDFREYYSSAEINEIFMIFGSAGFLEVVANQNSAKNLLNVGIGDKITVVLKN